MPGLGSVESKLRDGKGIYVLCMNLGDSECFCIRYTNDIGINLVHWLTGLNPTRPFLIYILHIRTIPTATKFRTIPIISCRKSVL
jgi:hypothetical protein